MQQVSQVFINLYTQQQLTREGGSLGSRLIVTMMTVDMVLQSCIDTGILKMVRRTIGLEVQH